MASTIVNALGKDVEKGLSNKNNLSEYKDMIDKYLSNNTTKYFISGPGERPIFSTDMANKYIQLIGLDRDKINKVIKDSKSIGSNWYIMNNPFNVANVLATRYFAIKKDKDFLKYTKWYLLVSMYPTIHFKYFKYGTNEACMNYTVANLTGKYKLKQTANMWSSFTEMIDTAYELHEKKIIEGDDKSFVKYIQDVHTRMNSLVKNIAREYYDNYENQRYLKSEHESFEEDSYYEADSNSYLIERLTNKVVTHLVVNGPDMKLVQLAAKTNSVSVNELRNYTQTMVNEKQREDIRTIVEALLFLFLNSSDVQHTSKDIGTNTFMIYCLQVYKRSNTTDKNVIKIKSILDRWLDELGVSNRISRAATIVNFRRALYTFFVMSIQKIAG